MIHRLNLPKIPTDRSLSIVGFGDTGSGLRIYRTKQLRLSIVGAALFSGLQKHEWASAPTVPLTPFGRVVAFDCRIRRTPRVLPTPGPATSSREAAPVTTRTGAALFIGGKKNTPPYGRGKETQSSESASRKGALRPNQYLAGKRVPIGTEAPLPPFGGGWRAIACEPYALARDDRAQHGSKSRLQALHRSRLPDASTRHGGRARDVARQGNRVDRCRRGHPGAGMRPGRTRCKHSKTRPRRSGSRRGRCIEHMLDGHRYNCPCIGYALESAVDYRFAAHRAPA
jgi:hypothetical protein